MRKLVDGLAHAFGVVAILALFWLAAASIELAARLEVARGAAAYERDELVVETVRLDSHTRKGGGTSYHCYAEGPVGATREQLTLDDCMLDGERVVTAQAAVGERIDVLVNRGISAAGPAAARRTVRYRPDVEAHAWQRVVAFLPWVYGPLVLAVALALLMWTIGRVAYGRGAGAWSLWVPVVGVALQAAVLGLYEAM
ncbi:MAG TPA: hypothetical protein VFO79_02005 [Xanthomonadales bacterium]|nr:hypothetical protein [Xanthomonadales bacterium]